MSEWQPIETAPKDGTTVLLYREVVPFKVVGYGRWEDVLGISGWISYGFHRGGGDASNLGLAAPTHWMPLPAPPVVGCVEGATQEQAVTLPSAAPTS